MANYVCMDMLGTCSIREIPSLYIILNTMKFFECNPTPSYLSCYSYCQKKILLLSLLLLFLLLYLLFAVFVQIADHGFYVVHGNSWLLWSQNNTKKKKKIEKKIKNRKLKTKKKKYQAKPFKNLLFTFIW